MKKENVLLGSIVGGALIATGVYMATRRTIPKGVVAVKPFDVKKYMGKWYEIARLDYRFEKGLDNVTAEYSLNEDGTVKVMNSGYNYRKGVVEESVGKAEFVNEPDEAMLEVSFWGPIKAGYNVIAIDKAYKYALVVGRNRKYMWLLSRETSMPEKIKLDYLAMARNLGYKTEKLIWSEHK